jgi:hypothetical protein
MGFTFIEDSFVLPCSRSRAAIVVLDEKEEEFTGGLQLTL